MTLSFMDKSSIRIITVIGRIVSCQSKSPKSPLYLRQFPVGTGIAAPNQGGIVTSLVSKHMGRVSGGNSPITRRSEMRIQAQIVCPVRVLYKTALWCAAQISSSRPATRKSTHP